MLPGQEKPILETKLSNPGNNLPDYRSFREHSQDHWLEYVTTDQGFSEAVKNLLSQFVLLPRATFQLPIVLSYLMLPSVVCSSVPILFSHGLSGSGKSAIGEFCCAIQGTKAISAGSTFASIRNAIKQQRWYDDEMSIEKYCSIVWEDVSPSELRKFEGAIFSLLKNGISRDGTITIALADGDNLEFPIFSPKLISSVHPIYSEYDFRELVRRVIVIQHKPVKNWGHEDFEGNESPDPNDLLDVNDIDWSGFSFEFQKFWNNPSNLTQFAEVSKKLNRIRAHGIDKPLYKISKDLIATGVVCGYWEDTTTAIAHMKDYWQWHQMNIASQSSQLQKILELFIKEKSLVIEERNRMLTEAGQTQGIRAVELNPTELQSWWRHHMQLGNVEPGTSTRQVNEAMLNLGWRLQLNAQSETKWLRITG